MLCFIGYNACVTGCHPEDTEARLVLINEGEQQVVPRPPPNYLTVSHATLIPFHFHLAEKTSAMVFGKSSAVTGPYERDSAMSSRSENQGRRTRDQVLKLFWPIQD